MQKEMEFAFLETIFVKAPESEYFVSTASHTCVLKML